jgi:RNA 3'-phosphate cyclase
MIHIDGSCIEGGGQILRTALALSTLSRRPFTADKIRHNRPKPGLKAQHLSCIDALIKLARAQVKGAEPGSAAIEFAPGEITPGVLSLDIGTAGSITLLLQSLLLPCMFADDKVVFHIKGGTDTKWSIPIDYFSHVVLPFFREFALIELNDMKRGFYPKGQGFIRLTIKPRYYLRDHRNLDDFVTHLRKQIPGIYLSEKSQLERIEGISVASERLKGAKVAERQAESATQRLRALCPLRITNEYQPTASVGTVITLWTVSRQRKVLMGADALGERGIKAERVGAKAAKKLLEVLNSEAVVDRHLADNLIPLLALVGGEIKTDKITGHIRSNIYVCEKFLDVKFLINEEQNQITVM